MNGISNSQKIYTEWLEGSMVLLRKLSIVGLVAVIFNTNCFGGVLDYMGYRLGYDHLMKRSGSIFRREYVACDTLVEAVRWYKVMSCNWDTAQKLCTGRIDSLYFSDINGDLYNTFDFSAKGVNPVVYLKSTQYQKGGYLYQYTYDTVSIAGETRFEFLSAQVDPMGTVFFRRYVYGLGLVEESVSMLISGEMKTQWTGYLQKDYSSAASISKPRNSHRKNGIVNYVNVIGQKATRASNSHHFGTGMIIPFEKH